MKKQQFIRHIFVPLLGAVALTCSSLALAQWKWVDANGGTHFSDRAPPPNTPENRILQRPSGSTAATARRTVREPEPTLADGDTAEQDNDEEVRRLEDARRQQEAEAQRLRAEQERLDAAKRAQACTDAQRNLETLNTGVRIRMLDDKGEFYYINDQQRAQRQQEAQQRINEYCN